MLKKQKRSDRSRSSKKHDFSTTIMASKVDASTPAKMSVWRRILTWLGWAVVYAFVFYLGNLSGEYVAAHMPILPSLPRVSVDVEKLKNMMPKVALPKVSFSWNWPTSSKKSAPDVPHTKLAVVRGQFINVPIDTATDAERQEFVASIEKLAQDATTVSVSESCELNPAFIRIKSGNTIMLTNNIVREHTIVFDQASSVFKPKDQIVIKKKKKTGAYSILCDGSTIGFYLVY